MLFFVCNWIANFSILLFLFLVGREGGGEKKGATMQPKEVRAFLEDTTRAALIPAHSRLQQQVMTM